MREGDALPPSKKTSQEGERDGGGYKKGYGGGERPPPLPLLSRWERGNYIPLPLFRAKEALELVCRERRSAQRRRGGPSSFGKGKL